MSDVAQIAGSLTKAQRALASGRYDDDFASHDDAATLERLSIWKTVAPDDEDEFPRFENTPLGLQVRAHLLSETPHGES